MTAPELSVGGFRPEVHVDVADAPGRRERSARTILQFAAPLAVLAVVTYFEFELDRFYVPKELPLHFFTFISALLLFGSLRRSPRLRVELLLGAFLLLSIVSAVLATNVWVAIRAVAVTVRCRAR